MKSCWQMRQANHCDAIVMGHTHQDDLTATIANSGNWMNYKPSFLKIYPDGAIELYRWQAISATAGKPVLRCNRLPDGTVEIFEPFAKPRPATS
jgi:hypothetical protein